jgi:anti-sigma regulatory factor (Ser/Thr protein kinase)
VVHAAGGEYVVHVEIEDQECHIRVIDSGIGFTASGTDRAMALPTESGGRGIALMEQLMDQTQFESPPESGTVVHLQKRLNLTDDSPL